MSTAELKHALLRAIDQLPEARLEQLLESIKQEKDTNEEEKNMGKLRFGALKGGLVYMSPDFDEPLEDFKDYR